MAVPLMRSPRLRPRKNHRCGPGPAGQPLRRRCSMRRDGDEQVGDVDDHDRHARHDEEDLRVAEVDDEDRDRDHADDDGRERGRLPLLGDVRQVVAERQGVVAGHGEREPDGGGVDREAADEDRERHVREQHLADPGAERVLEDATAGRRRRAWPRASDLAVSSAISSSSAPATPAAPRARSSRGGWSCAGPWSPPKASRRCRSRT